MSNYVKSQIGLNSSKQPYIKFITYNDDTKSEETSKIILTAKNNGIWIQDVLNNSTEYKLDYKGLNNEVVAARADDIGSNTYTSLEDKLHGTTEELLNRIGDIPVGIFKFIGHSTSIGSLTALALDPSNLADGDYLTLKGTEASVMCYIWNTNTNTWDKVEGQSPDGSHIAEFNNETDLEGIKSPFTSENDFWLFSLESDNSGHYYFEGTLNNLDFNLTFDETPTINSSNPVTSRGIFNAINGLVKLPEYTINDVNKYLRVVNTGTLEEPVIGLIYDSTMSGLPTPYLNNAFLRVNSTNTPYWSDDFQPLEYYVNYADGDDGNPGTQTSPLKHLSYALDFIGGKLRVQSQSAVVHVDNESWDPNPESLNFTDNLTILNIDEEHNYPIIIDDELFINNKLLFEGVNFLTNEHPSILNVGSDCEFRNCIFGASSNEGIDNPTDYDPDRQVTLVVDGCTAKLNNCSFSQISLVNGGTVILDDACRVFNGYTSSICDNNDGILNTINEVLYADGDSLPDTCLPINECNVVGYYTSVFLDKAVDEAIEEVFPS